jgi:hypothetical protein
MWAPTRSSCSTPAPSSNAARLPIGRRPLCQHSTPARGRGGREPPVEDPVATPTAIHRPRLTTSSPPTRSTQSPRSTRRSRTMHPNMCG